jgi:hypothetical protein
MKDSIPPLDHIKPLRPKPNDQKLVRELRYFSKAKDIV